ncbi:MAG: 30S ribosomal protein S12 methylthiotransferase RimO [Actinomycetota bacterium]|nr:30S ribosomal protein S12 methylthiotransferase RimO [Actinomycetota bacterium]
MPAVPTVAIVTLGCARNEVDSAQLAGSMVEAGYRYVDDPRGADVVLVNTCTFITPASQESVDTVLAACDLKQGGTRAVLVVGCMAERYRDQLAAELPEADAVVGFGAYPRLPQIVGDVLAGRPVARFAGAPPDAAARNGTRSSAASLPLLPADGSRRGYQPQDALDRIPPSGPQASFRSSDADRPWAYLKIASGCDRACTFCAIPSWRGRFRSRPLAEVVAEAEWLVDRGARELVLVSENTTSWGKDLPGGRSLQVALLERLSAIDRLEWIRLVYLQPAELQPPLVEAIAQLPKVASYFDLSLQHVSAGVLARMARSGSSERWGALVADVRDLDPDAVFRSSFIVGFPGETDADHRELVTFLEDQRLDWVGLFAFSPQDGTPAAAFTEQVPADLVDARLNELVDLQERVAEDAARRFVGRRLRATVQGVFDGVCLARSYREAPDTDGDIRLVAPDGLPVTVPTGRTIDVDVLAADGVDLVAVPRLPDA